MADPLKVPGRRVRRLNEVIDFELAAAKKVLFRVLGNTDPVQYHRAMSVALEHVEAAHVACYEIEQICAADAARGKYKETS